MIKMLTQIVDSTLLIIFTTTKEVNMMINFIKSLKIIIIMVIMIINYYTEFSVNYLYYYSYSCSHTNSVSDALAQIDYYSLIKKYYE